MLSPSQQSVFRPLVQHAWEYQCRVTGRNVRDRLTRDAWYREQLAAATGGRLRSTREASADDYWVLIGRFTLLSECGQAPAIAGFTDRQNEWFRRIAERAWRRCCERHTADGVDFPTWLDRELALCGIEQRNAPDRVKTFDRVLSHFAILAGDERAIDKASRADEDRMRWQIRQFMSDLEWLEQKPVTWEYVSAIYTQARLLPALDEAPALVLWKVLQMLDTHIRRLCRDRMIEPSELPSRRAASGLHPA